LTDSARSESNIRVCIALFVLALALRAGFSLSLGKTLYWQDEQSYLKVLSSVFNNHTWYLPGTFKPPGYVYFLAGVRLFVGQSLTAIRLAQSVVGALACVLTFLVARRLFSRTAGLIAGIYTCVYPLLIYVCGVVLPQALETLLVIGVVWLLLAFSESADRRLLAACGVVLGLGALVVPLILAIAPVAALWAYSVRRWRILPAAKDVLVLGGITLLMIVPWTIRNYVVEKRFIFIATMGNQLLYVHNNPWADPDDKETTRAMSFKLRDEVADEALRNPSGPTEDEIFLQRFRDFVTQHPGRFAVIYLKKFKNFFSLFPSTFSKNEHTVDRNKLVAAITYAPVLVLWLFGAAVSLRSNRQALILFAIPVLFAMGYSVFHTTVRYRVPTEPCSIILATYGLLWILSRTGLLRRSPEGRTV
jgi:4-amino-4-deoxy-L-arabinose transferase-like glycosyltransferase